MVYSPDKDSEYLQKATMVSVIRRYMKEPRWFSCDKDSEYIPGQ